MQEAQFKPGAFEFVTAVTFIYPEYHTAEYLQGISEYTPISDIVSRLLPSTKEGEGEKKYKGWDKHKHYTAENVRVFYPNKWQYRAYHLYAKRVWYEVPLSLTLSDVFAQETYAIPNSCAFYIIDPHSDFFSIFSEF